MGVYLPNLEMPENCFECPWRCKVDPENLLCRISGEYFEETFSGTIQNRHKSCPLVPVPPHGRCIDAAEFLKRAIGTKCFRGDYALMLEELVGESATIIPASKEDA